MSQKDKIDNENFKNKLIALKTFRAESKLQKATLAFIAT